MNPLSVKKYLRDDLRGDLVASLTVAAVGIPQAMAYAIIAGVPPAYGLYTGIVTCILGSLLRSSSFLITGPTNATAMLIAGTLQPYFTPDQFPQMVLLLTFLTGLIQVSFGLLRLSGVVRYISNSVVVGITAGAGVLIIGNQLVDFFGLNQDVTRADMSFFVAGVAKLFWRVAQRMARGDLPILPVSIGAFTIAFILGARRIAPRWPAPLLAVALSAIIVKGFQWHSQGIRTVEELGAITRSLNLFMVPEPILQCDFKAAGDLFTGAIAVAILGLVEAVSIAKALATQSGQRVNFTREFTGQGLANMVGAFFRCFVGSGSFTRSAINYHSGARTRMAGVFSGAATALVLVAFAPYANAIPIASLAGLLIVICMRMIDRHQLRLAWHSGESSRMVFLVTFGSSILLGLKYAIFVGVFASIVFLLRATREPGIKRIIIHPNGDVEELPEDSTDIATPVALIDLTGDFYFAAVQDLDLKLRHAIPPGAKALILRMREMRALGSTGVGTLQHFCQLMRAQGVTVILTGVEAELERIIRRSGFLEEIGEENVFYADPFVFRATQLAFARARALIESHESGAVGNRGELGGRPASAEKANAAREVLAKDIMRHDVIRFGIEHGLREAVWLLREGRKRKPDLKRLFLQGDDARLAGAVGLHQILRQFLNAATSPPESGEGPHQSGFSSTSGVSGASDFSDPSEAVKGEIRKGWMRIHRHRLRAIVQHGSELVPPAAGLRQVASAMLKHGVDIIPVAQDGRITGQVFVRDVVAALRSRQAQALDTQRSRPQVDP